MQWEGANRPYLARLPVSTVRDRFLRLRAEAEAEMTSSPFAAQTSDDDDDQQRRGLVTSSDDDVINPRRSSSRSRRRRFASRYRHLRKEH